MSYLALARKWRPRTFSQLMGQEHISKIITKSLEQKRLHHAYLFTGTRGVGKTSIARLIAKALNCEQGISASPCLQCDACLAIEQGRFIDLIEIDAASKTRVEDTRELLDNVHYAATTGRFKIYLIDEVHMLSQHSFNALLKTLEEPPEHVKFLLATTDPQKLPVTVLSRCLQFHLKPIAPSTIAEQLKLILNEEQLAFEPEALNLLAKAADGSMRDALSLLDQAIAAADKTLTVSDIKTMLGYTQQEYAIQILQALNRNNAGELITISRKIADESGHFKYVLNSLLETLHQITVHQALENQSPLLGESVEIQQLAEQLSPTDVQLFYQITLKGCEDLHLAPMLNIGFEMTLLRMLTFKPANKSPFPVLAHHQSLPAAQNGKHSAKQIIEDKPNPVIEKITPVKDLKPAAEPIKEENSSKYAESLQDWSKIITCLKLNGLALTAAENAEFVGKNQHEITLRVAKGHQSLFTTSVTQRLEQALIAFYKEKIKLTFLFEDSVASSPAQKKQVIQSAQQQEAENSIAQDEFVKKLQHEFSAEVVKNSIDSLKNGL